ncbi:DUF6542 domain-containing protein [Nocardioides sp. SYSU D00038]|uniref:DUF6542 domain-containing protein n=1 Tax=Nocardioides sp. SYSU D00038 TaxID=2812554 RepID=UPI0019679104|nr:DUF6542 domain-containing protein [Nocardioides sp. SYSU D00038]
MASERSVWVDGQESGRQVVALGAAVALTVVVVDIALFERVGVAFDLCFVALCVGLALQVRPGDFYTVAVLPPLLLTGVFGLLAATRPATIAHGDDGFVQALVAGIAHHAVALGVGYALCLGCLALRDRALRRTG